MIKTHYLVLAILCLFACNPNKDSNKLPGYQKDTASYQKDTLPNTIVFRPNFSLVIRDTSSINLTFFDSIPETISNPAEFFTYDTTKLSDKHFIFLTNSTDYGIIKNNGKDIYVAKQHQNSSEVSDDIFKNVFSGNGFTVTLTTKHISNNDGVSYEKGTLEVKNSKFQTSYTIHGGYRIL